MKIILTMEEVNELVLACVATPRGFDTKSIRYIHRYRDGSGEEDVENITAIHRIEIELEKAS